MDFKNIKYLYELTVQFIARFIFPHLIFLPDRRVYLHFMDKINQIVFNSYLI